MQFFFHVSDHAVSDATDRRTPVHLVRVNATQGAMECTPHPDTLNPCCVIDNSHDVLCFYIIYYYLVVVAVIAVVLLPRHTTIHLRDVSSIGQPMFDRSNALVDGITYIHQPPPPSPTHANHPSRLTIGPWEDMCSQEVPRTCIDLYFTYIVQQ